MARSYPASSWVLLSIYGAILIAVAIVLRGTHLVSRLVPVLFGTAPIVLWLFFRSGRGRAA